MLAQSRVKNEITFIILQFLNEERYEETAHKLEQETRLFFNMNYLEELFTDGKWDEAENYVSKFTKAEDNSFSRNIYLIMRHLKYLEALDKEHKELAWYKDAKSARESAFALIREQIKSNPLLCDNLDFPTITQSRLQRLIKQRQYVREMKPLFESVTYTVLQTEAESSELYTL